MLLPLIVGVAGYFALFSKNASGQTNASKIFGPFMSFGPMPQSSIDNAAFALFKSNVRASEGYDTKVYYDTTGNLTVGIGHKVLAGDNLQYGEVITDARVQQLFEKDTAIAFKAAKEQAKELKKYTPQMIAALAEVNYQHGTGWNKIHKTAWQSLKNGDATKAIAALKNSLWYKQTPVRVANFINTIQEVYA